MKKKASYAPISKLKDGKFISEPAARLKQSGKQYETPQMRKPMPYKRPGKSTDS